MFTTLQYLLCISPKINETHRRAYMCITSSYNNKFFFIFFIFHSLIDCFACFLLYCAEIFHREHIAAVMCVTSAMNNTLIVSGGDDSSIIISSFSSGKSVSNKKDTFIFFLILELYNTQYSYIFYSFSLFFYCYFALKLR